MDSQVKEMLRRVAAGVEMPAQVPRALIRRASGRRIRNSLLAAATAGAVAMAAIVGVGALRRDPAIDFTSPPIEHKTTVKFPFTGAELTSGSGSIWLEAQSEVIRIDPESNQVIARIAAIGPSRAAAGGGMERDRYYFGTGGLAAGAGSVWVTGTGPFPEPVPSGGSTGGGMTVPPPPSTTPTPGGTSMAWSLFRIDPNTNAISGVATFDTGLLPTKIVAAAADDIWIATESPDLKRKGLIHRLNPKTGGVQTIQLEGSVTGLVFVEDFAWATVDVNRAGARGVVKLDPRDGRTLETILIPKAIVLQGLTRTRSTLWVATIQEGAVVVVGVDTRSATITGSIPVRAPIPSITAGDDYVWVTGQDERHVTRLDPIAMAITGRLPAGGVVYALLVDGTSLWVVADPDGEGGPDQGALTRYEV